MSFYSRAAPALHLQVCTSLVVAHVRIIPEAFGDQVQRDPGGSGAPETGRVAPAVRRVISFSAVAWYVPFLCLFGARRFWKLQGFPEKK